MPAKAKLKLHGQVALVVERIENIQLGDKLPTKGPELADLLYQSRAARLALQKVCEALEEQEKAAQAWFVANLPKSNATGIAGKVGRVTVESAQVPQVKDWPKFYAYVKKHNAFDMLTKKLSNKAITDRWDNKEQVDGVEAFGIVKVSCVKVGSK